MTILETRSGRRERVDARIGERLMRHSKVLCALVALSLALPAVAFGAAADVRGQLEELAVVVEQLGQWENAARLRGALDATPDAELEQVYGGTDLRPLIAALGQTAGTQAALRPRLEAVQAEFEAARRASAARARASKQSAPQAVMSAGLPDADYPLEPEFCPFHSQANLAPTRRSDTQTVIQATVDLNTAVQALEQVLIVRNLAQSIWAGLSRGCEQVISVVAYGYNLSLACIPVDIVFAAIEFVVAEAEWGIGIAQANLDMNNLCDALVDTVELTANYERVGHIHDDLDEFRLDMNQRLDVLDARWDLLLQVLLERDLQWDSGKRKGVNYTTRLIESCDAAQAAITSTAALGYPVHARAQPALDAGRLLIATDPKGALDLCRTAYRYATLR